MVTREGSVIVVTLLMMVMIGGCAAQPATNGSSAAAAIDGRGTTVMPVGQTDGTGMMPQTGVMSPMSPRPRLGDFVANEEIRDIHFDFDAYAIRPMDARILEASAQWLKAHPDSLLVIEGHADERGTNEYNVVLGERRAKASMNYLVAHGIQATRITVMSYGEERNVCGEKTEGCWRKNRRAHFLVKSR